MQMFLIDQKNGSKLEKAKGKIENGREKQNQRQTEKQSEQQIQKTYIQTKNEKYRLKIDRKAKEIKESKQKD